MKKVVSALLALVFVFSAIPLGGLSEYIEGIDWSFLALEASAAGKVYSGTCGKNVKWSLDTETGVLTISGSGEIPFYFYDDETTYSPWYSYSESVKSVVIQNGVTRIGESAFYGCDNLTSVTIGNGVTSISDDAFYICDSLTEINVSEANEYFSSVNGVLFNKDKTKLVCYPCEKIGAYTIPNSVKSIGDYAFDGCSSLTSVTIPDSVTSIGIYAFFGCSSLTSVMIPDSVTSIGYGAFEDCSNLTLITIPDSITHIGSFAFCDCSNLTSVTIGNSVKSIGDWAFEGCSSLTAINVSAGNKNYSSLNGVLFNKDKTELVCYPAGKTEASYTIPDSVKSIGEYAFESCDSLTSVTIPDSVTSIGYGAFEDCSSLTSVTIPDSVTSIGDYAFDGCSSLTSVTIPDSVTSIGDDAFYNCSRLTAVTIPDSVTSIGDSAFEDCSSLTSVTIPDSVTSIGDSAFCDCSSLTSVTIPNSVTSIGWRAFFDCSRLIAVTIPDSVTSIGDSAFEDCSSLTSVTIPDSVTSIGWRAFFDCNPALTIYGYKNSEAERYAKDEEIKFIALPALPGTVKLAKIENAAAGVTVTWSAASNAESYIVYRKAGSATSWSRLAVVKSSVKSYTDKTAKSGTSYTYTVKAQNANGAGGYNKTGLTIFYLSQPTVTAANANGAVTVKWGKITGATGYFLYRKAAGEKAWSKLADLKGNAAVTYKDKTVKSGIGYRYTVRACKSIYGSSYSSTGAVIRYLAQPTVTVANANGSVTVKWSKIAGAKGYYIYRKAGNATSWSKLATITSGTTVAYADKKVTSGTVYKYTVRAINATYASSYCTGAATRYLAAGKMTSAVSTKTGIALKWAKTAGATGYVVCRKAGSDSWKKLVTLKGSATVSYVDKSAKKGTTYKYCVRPYNGSYAGANANTVSCKDKY